MVPTQWRHSPVSAQGLRKNGTLEGPGIEARTCGERGTSWLGTWLSADLARLPDVSPVVAPRRAPRKIALSPRHL